MQTTPRRGLQQEHQLEEAVAVITVSSSPDYHLSIQRVLEDAGVTVVAAFSSATALSMVKRYRLNVVLFDDELSGGSWRSFLDEIQPVDPRPPVIIASRVADERIWADCLNRGAFDVLLRPFDAEETIRVVHAAIRTIVPTFRWFLKTPAGTITAAHQAIVEEETPAITLKPRQFTMTSLEEYGRMRPVRTRSTGPKKRVLVVDDDSQIRAFVCAALLPHHFELLEADGASSAISIMNASASPIDLVICDIDMPVVNGLELAGIVRDSYATCSVLLMSGGHTSKALEYPFLRKPFSAFALIRRVSELLHIG